MAETNDAAADILLNQPGPSPGNAPGAQRNDPSSAGQNIMTDAPNAAKGNPTGNANTEPTPASGTADADAAPSPVPLDHRLPAPEDDDGGLPWPAIVGGAVVAVFGVALLGQRKSKRAKTPPDEARKGVSRAPDGDLHNPNAAIAAGEGVKVQDVVTINKPASELFTFWRNFANLPQFMKHLESVAVADNMHSHWVAKAPLGKTVAWDAEIINEQPGRLIAWRTLPGADVTSAGTVRFEPAPGGRGTEVRVILEYKPPAGKVGVIVAKLFGEEPQQQVSSDLRRFKQLMETGEVATLEGQPAGKRSASAKMMEKLNVA